MMWLNSRRPILYIPRSIKSQEVVSRGFLCNFLFKNIANIFGAPRVVREILEQLDKAQEERGCSSKASLREADGLQVDGEGNVHVPEEIIIGQEPNIFGSKVYENIEALQDEFATMLAEETPDEVMKQLEWIDMQVVKAVRKRRDETF